MDKEETEFTELNIENYYGTLTIEKIGKDYYLTLNCVTTPGGFKPISEKLALLLMKELQSE